MSAAIPFQPITDLLERSLGIRHVYGEPVRHGDVTVIPVARVAYGFGAGIGRRERGGRARPQGRPEGAADDAPGSEPQGMGGGGGVRMSPVGALEIGPRGTRFIHYTQPREVLGALALGLGLGLMFGRRR